MASSSTPKKKAKAAPKTAVAIDQLTHRQLTKAAKELSISNADYASAAISYFTERGLDPLANREREGIVIQNKITELERVVNTLGNRLFGWLTQHEKNLNKDLFGFLRGHEKTLFAYLQAQDKNVHEHLADQEEMFLMPLMRELMITNVEALYSRRLGEQIILKVLGRELAEYPAKHKEFNERRDVDARKKLDAFIESLAPVTQPLATIPQPTPVPQRPASPAESPVSSAATSSEKSF
ncbi:hypothetical protein [Hymenobacter sp. DG01]|uniref:hypothetical protein n=1 Tax=Hymenobacter sp. DG01 TaxID=2584940 RepID=UPI001122A2CA|nr:hypothetical protein [Hymenobacter sp. DG01]